MKESNNTNTHRFQEDSTAIMDALPVYWTALMLPVYYSCDYLKKPQMYFWNQRNILVSHFTIV